MNWAPIWALPNIELDEPVESDFFALVPNNDPRVSKVKKDHSEFRRFIGQFTNTFGIRLSPCLILRRTDAPERVMTAEAAASFRDLLAASMAPYAQARNIAHQNTHHGADYSSFFWVHPWTTNRDYSYISAITPTISAVHRAKTFRGQSSPDLSPTSVRRGDFDEPLLQELLTKWDARYNIDSPPWDVRALFRSLNMSNQALLFPGGVDATIHDFGRIAALWVASFEILIHPGGDGRANLTRVLELLDRVPWINRRLGHRRYRVRIRNQFSNRNLACWLYRELYTCRNDFLHGNPVNIGNLRIQQSGRGLVPFGSILYRLALTSFLDLSFRDELPPPSQAEAFAAHVSERMNFEQPQKKVEEALLLARVSEEEQRRRRDEVIQNRRVRTKRVS